MERESDKELRADVIKLFRNKNCPFLGVDKYQAIGYIAYDTYSLRHMYINDIPLHNAPMIEYVYKYRYVSASKMSKMLNSTSRVMITWHL